MTNPLTRALPWIARMVARQCGIEVRFDPRAATASISANRVITLPNVPAGDHQSAVLALGYIVHEAFHAKFSDFDVIGETRSSLERDLLGVFEDARIEAAGMKGYQGARMYLTQMWQTIYDRGGVLRPTGKPTSLGQDAFAYALAYCRQLCLGLEPAKHDLPIARQTLAQHLGDQVAQRLEEIFGRVSGCISTWQALLLARETLQCLYEATGQRPPDESTPQPAPQQPKGRDKAPGQPQGGEEAPQHAQAGGEASQRPQGGEEAPQHAQAGGEAPQQPQGSDVDSQRSQGNDAGPDLLHGGDIGAGQGRVTDDTSDVVPAASSWQDDLKFQEAMEADLQLVVGDLGPLLAQHLKEAIIEARASSGGRGVQDVMLNAAELADPEKHEQSPAHAAELLVRTAAATSALRATIRHLLVSMTEEDTRYAAHGRVKPTRLWRLRTGTQNVFERTVDGVEVDTAVTVLLDVSSSMKGAKLQLATEAMVAVSLAIDGVAGISTSVCAFPGRTDQHVSRLKRFNESAQRASARLAGVKAHGSTPLAEAIYAVGDELVQQSACGHMLIVVTDGEPNNATTAAIALRELEQDGVDIVGVGIGCDVSHLFERSIELRDQRELATRLFQVLSERFKSYAAMAA